MVDIETLIETIEQQRLKFSNPKVARDFAKWNKTMQYHFTDIDGYYLIRFVDGQTQPVVEEQAPQPDIQYDMDTDTFLAISRKEITGLKAYQQKKVRLKASMPDMIKLQKIDKL